MTKSHPYNELGEKKCIECGKRLKKRIEEERPEWTKCYRCYNRLPPKQQE
jgi:hypothetical protein